jgi:hypothetical protein
MNIQEIVAKLNLVCLAAAALVAQIVVIIALAGRN